MFFFFEFCSYLRFTFGQVEGNARNGLSRHRSFRVCKVNIAILKVAIEVLFSSYYFSGEDEKIIQKHSRTFLLMYRNSKCLQ